MNKIKIYLLALLIVVMPLSSHASATSYVTQAALWEAGQVAVTAVKNGISKGIKVTPSPSKLAKRLPQAALILGATSLLGSSVDYVLDPANNSVIVKETVTTDEVYLDDGCRRAGSNNSYRSYDSTVKSLVRVRRNTADYLGVTNLGKISDVNFYRLSFKQKSTGALYDVLVSCGFVTETISTPIPNTEIAQAVITAAQAGNTEAQGYVVDAVAQDVNSGTYDRSLDYAPTVDGVDGQDGADGADGADVDTSGIIAAIESMSSGLSGQITSMQGALVGSINDIKTGIADLIGLQTEQIIEGQTAQTGELVTAIEASTTATGEVIGQQTQDILEGQRVQTGDIVGAIDAQTTATGEVIGQQTQDIVDAIDNIDVNTDNSDVVDAVNTSTDTVTDNANVNAGKITDSINAQTKAQEDTIAEASDDLASQETQLDIPDVPLIPVNTTINFGGSCPANFAHTYTMFGRQNTITLLDTSKLCGFLAKFVKWPVYVVSSIIALRIYGGS